MTSSDHCSHGVTTLQGEEESWRGRGEPTKQLFSQEYELLYLPSLPPPPIPTTIIMKFHVTHVCQLPPTASKSTVSKVKQFWSCHQGTYAILNLKMFYHSLRSTTHALLDSVTDFSIFHQSTECIFPLLNPKPQPSPHPTTQKPPLEDGTRGKIYFEHIKFYWACQHSSVSIWPWNHWTLTQSPSTHHSSFL